MTTTERVYSVPEPARALGISPRTLKAALARGLLGKPNRALASPFALAGFSQGWIKSAVEQKIGLNFKAVTYPPDRRKEAVPKVPGVTRVEPGPEAEPAETADAPNEATP